MHQRVPGLIPSPRQGTGGRQPMDVSPHIDVSLRIFVFLRRISSVRERGFMVICGCSAHDNSILEFEDENN